MRELASLGRLRSYPKNTVFITEGDSSDSVFVVLSGRVKIFLSDTEGHEMILDTQGPGEYVGEMALDGNPRSASVMTMEATTFSVVARDPIKEAIRRNPDFALDMISKIIDRARLATNSVKDLALLDVYGRVARLLLNMAVERNGKLEIPEKLTQQEIAERVGRLARHGEPHLPRPHRRRVHHRRVAAHHHQQEAAGAVVNGQSRAGFGNIRQSGVSIFRRGETVAARSLHSVAGQLDGEDGHGRPQESRRETDRPRTRVDRDRSAARDFSVVHLRSAGRDDRRCVQHPSLALSASAGRFQPGFETVFFSVR